MQCIDRRVVPWNHAQHSTDRSASYPSIQLLPTGSFRYAPSPSRMPTAFGREPGGETRQGGACNSCECCTALRSNVRALWATGASHQLTLIIFQEEDAARLPPVKNDQGAGCHSIQEDGIPGCSDRAVALASFVPRNLALSPMLGSHRTSGARSCSRIHVINLDHMASSAAPSAAPLSRAGRSIGEGARCASPHMRREAVYGCV